MIHRRTFLRRSLGALGATTATTTTLPALGRSTGSGRVRIGMISDVHQDVMHDGPRRLGAFLEAMREEQPDFIVQLGDFCKPIPANQPFIDLWNGVDLPRHHVIGNHDMDGGFRREQTVEWYGMSDRFYAFEQGGVRFVVLDGNDPGGTRGGYNRFIAEDQKAWLDAQLDETVLPVVVLIHQPLDHPMGVVNQEEIRALLERYRGPEHAGVAAVFAGHCHQDYVRRIHGIAHVQINSASYVWLPGNARRQVYDEAAHRARGNLDRVAPYRDPLWAVVTLDHDTGTLDIRGRTSEWVGPDPWERGAPESDYPRETHRPAITDWRGPIRGERRR